MNNEALKIQPMGFFIWAIAAFFFLYEFFLRTFVGSIAHQLIHDIHLSISQFTLLGTAYYATYGLMQIPVGLLADKFGIRYIMLFAVLVCTFATFLFAHTTNFGIAILARVLMGFGSSFAFICLLVIAITWFPRRLFGFYSGASQFIGTMGPLLAAGPLISWLLALHMNWREALSIIAMVGVGLAVVTALFVTEKPRSDEYSMIFLSRTQPALARIKKLFKIRQIWPVVFYSTTVYISISILGAMWGTQYLQSTGISQTKAAYTISITWLAYALGCPVMGFLSDYTKRRKPYLIACSVMGLVGTTLILVGQFTTVWIYHGLFFLIGLAAAGQNIGFTTISEYSGSQNKATALGLNNGLITFSAALLPLLISCIINFYHSGTAKTLQTHSLAIGLSLLPILYLVALLISVFFFKETYAKQQKSFIILEKTSASK